MKMMRSPIQAFFGMGAWAITAIASINIGLTQIEYGFMFPMWMNYVIGFSGAISLVALFMGLACCDSQKGCRSKDSCDDDCNKKCACGNPYCKGCNKNYQQKNGMANKSGMCDCGKSKGMCNCDK